MATDAPPPPPPPPSIDDYKLATTFHGTNITIHPHQQQLWARIRPIGTGAFGDVWLEQRVPALPAAASSPPAALEAAADRAADADLRAVKRIRHTGHNPDWSRELKILAQLKNNPSFVDFIGWYDDRGGYVCLAMEYMRHGDLSQYLQRAGPSARPQAKSIIAQVLRGLLALHEQGICHRDIKSKNILVAHTSPIHVKLADFGLSKRATAASSLRTACGTTHYLAPELQGFVRPRRSYTHLVDIWALGIVAHEVLTGQLPFLRQRSSDPDSDDDDDDDDDSGVDADADEDPYPEMDMLQLAAYCAGEAPFPRAALDRARVSALGVRFVEAVLVAAPRDRVSAERALAHPWLVDPAPEGGVGGRCGVVRFGVRRAGVVVQRYGRERRVVDV